jgi:tellurite resistance protein
MSLGLLVGRFGNFLLEQPVVPTEAWPEPSFPGELERLRGQFGHHLVLLMLLSRADGEAALQERQVILDFYLAESRKAGKPATATEAAELGDYLRDLRPTTAQFGPAIRRLEDAEKDEVVALVAAAIAVVDADGARRAREVEFLAELSRELHAL